MAILGSGKNSLFDTQSQGLRQNERNMLMNLNREVISQQGVETYYLQNKYVNVDSIFGEDRRPLLNTAKKIVMYIKDAFDAIQGDAIYSKFGFTNNQTMDFIISVKEWQTIFPMTTAGNTVRPVEGDIIYVPRWSQFGPTDFWKITFVDKYDANGYFPVGEHYAFTIQTEKWSYSSEDLSTGVTEIDSQETAFSNDVAINNNFQADPAAQNTAIETKADTILNWTESNPFGNG